jgi:hypothetical protein
MMNDMLSQEEIDALMSGASSQSNEPKNESLNDMEIDAIGGKLVI